MMMSDSTPLKYISRMVRPKRRNAVPECSSITRKKRAAKPMRPTLWIVLLPRFSIVCLSTQPSEPQVVRIGRRRIVERHRAVRLAMHELVHVGQPRGADFLSRTLGDDHAFRDEIHVVDNLQRFLHVMG